MQMQSSRSLVSLAKQCRVIPVVESRTQFTQVLENSHARAIFLRHCNVFDFATVLQNSHRRGYAVYINIDHIDGIHADVAGLQYLAEHLHITGIISNHPKTLSLGKQFGLETIQRLFAVDSTGLDNALESVDTRTIDLLDISPALVIPYITLHLKMVLPLPFIGSGLITTSEQVQAVLRAGAIGVAALRPELWL